MGRIPEYQRRQLASAYTGDRMVDRSGEILAEGISKAVNTGAQLMMRRQREIDATEADLYFTKFKDQVTSIQEQTRFDAQKDLQSDLMSVPKQVQEKTRQSAKQVAQTIRSRGARKLFQQAAAKYVFSVHSEDTSWAYRTQGERAKAMFETSIITRASAMGQIDDPQEVKAALDEMRQRIDADQLTAPDSKERLWERYSAKGVKDHLLMQLERNPSGFIRRLTNGEYKDFQEYFGSGGTEALIKEARQRVEALDTIRIAQDIPAHIDVYRQLVDLGDAPTAVMQAEAEYERLVLEQAAAKRDGVEFPADKAEAMKGYEAIIKYAFNMDRRLGKNSNPAVYERLESEIDTLRTELARHPRDKELSRRVLTIQKDLIEALGKGDISVTARGALEARLHKSIAGKRKGTVVFSKAQALEYAAKGPAWFGEKNEQDVAYPQIKKRVAQFFQKGTMEYQTALENAYQQFNEELSAKEEFLRGRNAEERAQAILNSSTNAAGKETSGLLDRLDAQYRGYKLKEGSLHPTILKKVMKLSNGQAVINVSDAEFQRIMENQ